jgi:hypothetical protein
MYGKGIKDVRDLVEIDNVWREEYGLSVGVAMANIITPKRIEGVGKFKAFKMSVLANYINMITIQDQRLYWNNGDGEIKEGRAALKYSEIERIKKFLVVKGIIVPPNTSLNNWVADHRPCRMMCAIHDKQDQLIASFENQCDMGVFKLREMHPIRCEGGRLITNIYFCLVFGFEKLPDPSRISIYPKLSSEHRHLNLKKDSLAPVLSDRFGVYHGHALWYMDENIFHRV